MNFTRRATEKEILDDFDLDGNDLSENLDEIAKVNKFLGGYSSVLKGITKIIKSKDLRREILILDAGCGGGDVLRMLSRNTKVQNGKLKLEGIDANSKAVKIARKKTDSPKIRFAQMNIFSPEFQQLNPDVFMFNLCLHHFENEEIIDILKNVRAKNSTLLISDLRRSKTAYFLFKVFSKIFRISKISRHDGLLSIRKGFLEKEWWQLLQKAGFQKFTVQDHWAFRHLIIAEK